MEEVEEAVGRLANGTAERTDDSCGEHFKLGLTEESTVPKSFHELLFVDWGHEVVLQE